MKMTSGTVTSMWPMKELLKLSKKGLVGFVKPHSTETTQHVICYLKILFNTQPWTWNVK